MIDTFSIIFPDVQDIGTAYNIGFKAITDSLVEVFDKVYRNNGICHMSVINNFYMKCGRKSES